MDNEELANYLRQSIRTEESAERIYCKHMRSVILRSDLPENIKEEVRAMLDQLGQDSKNHRNAVEKMLNELEGGKEYDQ